MAYVKKSDNGSNEATRESLTQIQKDIQETKNIENELMTVWNKIRDDGVSMCPKDTGLLSSTIRIIKTGVGGTMISGQSGVKSNTIFDRTIVAGDLTKINRKTHGRCNYAGLVHDGYTRKDGKQVAGRPFLTMALAKHNVELETAINKALAKIGKKNKDPNETSPPTETGTVS